MKTTLLLLAALCGCAGGAGRRTAQDVPEPGGIEVHAFGVYEGGPSEVVLQRAEGPVLLVLTGYEAKTWRISHPGGSTRPPLRSRDCFSYAGIRRPGNR